MVGLNETERRLTRKPKRKLFYLFQYRCLVAVGVPQLVK
jgi:hypothetical protein